MIKKAKHKKPLLFYLPLLAAFVVMMVVLVAGAWLFGSRIMTGLNQRSVVVRLKWLHQAQFAGLYLADQHGYYQKAGLQVELRPFDYQNFPIDEVVAGRAQFGVTSADELLKARSEGKKIKAIAVIFQESPAVVYALTETNITKPQDLRGKTLGIQKSSGAEQIIKAMLSSQGIDYNRDMKKQDIGFDLKPVTEKKVDAAMGYAFNEPIQLEEMGYSVTTINPSLYGIKLYADVLFTTEELINNNPQLVQKFVSASLQGWSAAIDHPEEAVAVTLKYPDVNNSALNLDHQTRLFAKSIPLIKPNLGTKIGQMDYVRWKKVYDLLKDNQLIQTDLNVADAYTTQFLGVTN